MIFREIWHVFSQNLTFDMFLSKIWHDFPRNLTWFSAKFDMFFHNIWHVFKQNLICLITKFDMIFREIWHSSRLGFRQFWQDFPQFWCKSKAKPLTLNHSSDWRVQYFCITNWWNKNMDCHIFFQKLSQQGKYWGLGLGHFTGSFVDCFP